VFVASWGLAVSCANVVILATTRGPSGTAFKPRADDPQTTDARSASPGAAPAFRCRRRRHLRRLRPREIHRRVGPIVRSQPHNAHQASRPARCAPPPRGQEDDRRPRRQGRSHVPRRPLPRHRGQHVQGRHSDLGSRVPQGRSPHQTAARMDLLTSTSARSPGPWTRRRSTVAPSAINAGSAFVYEVPLAGVLCGSRGR